MLQKLSRWIFFVVGGAVGFGIFRLAELVLPEMGYDYFSDLNSWQGILVALIFVLIFALIFFLMAPMINKRSAKVAKEIEIDLSKMAPGEIFMGTVGIVMGIILAFLLSNLFNLIEIPYLPTILSIITYALFAYVGAIVGTRQGMSFKDIFPQRKTEGKKKGDTSIPKIFDTSVIIDGRIYEIMGTGFLEGPIIIPEFVLIELQHIADSSDSLKRQRGRRGLDILKKIQTEYDVEIYGTIGEKALDEIPEVDIKLLKLAQMMGGKVVTNDFNLNKVAGIKGVAVLNINELANTLKPVVIPGEKMTVLLVKEGKERSQALAYLDDGTMIVVEDARKSIGKEVVVSVTSVLQTSAGRMIFARILREL